MRTPYRTVKGNHPGGGVPQEEYDRVVAELEKKTQEYNAKSALVSGITIEGFLVNGGNATLGTDTIISREENGVNYGFVLYHMNDTSDYNMAISGTIKRKNQNFTHVSNDIVSATHQSTNNWSSGYPTGPVYTNGSTILVDVCVPHRYESSHRYYRGTWNYKGNNAVSRVRISKDDPIPSGYTPINKNEWIKSINLSSQSSYPEFTSVITLK